MEILGYAASALIGVSLGLVGGGGSIMTIPVLVYLLGTSPLLATSYSLFIVGSTSMVGAYNSYRKGLVNFKTALLFGPASATSVFVIRKFIIPLVPTHIAQIGSFELTENILTMILFAVLMLAAALAMIGNGQKNEDKNIGSTTSLSLGKLLGYGAAIGLATGVLGAGGGFLIVPTLVLLVGLPIKEAVGTSLLIIAVNSLIGFAGDLGHFAINWPFLIKITALAIAGIFIGDAINKKVDSTKLKKGFGWFVLIMGIYIITKELYL